MEVRELRPADPDVCGVDLQAILFNMRDRFTGSHLRLLTMRDDLPAGLMTASLSGTVSPAALMNRRTGRLGRQVVRLISRPGDDSN